MMMSFVLVILITTNLFPIKPEQSSKPFCHLSRLFRFCTKQVQLRQLKTKQTNKHWNSSIIPYAFIFVFIFHDNKKLMLFIQQNSMDNPR